MAITLETTVYPARTQLSGQGSLTLESGKRLKIEVLPHLETLLDAEVPKGKTWNATITVCIEETDA